MNPKGNFPIVHGMSDTPTHFSWKAMRRRCNNPKDQDYPNYGGRGIKVCARWNDFRNFLEDMGVKPKGYSLERRDNNKDYEPGNCQWIPKQDQAKNRRINHSITINGVTNTLAGWCAQSGVHYYTALNRLRRGWPPETAIKTPATNKWHSPVAGSK